LIALQNIKHIYFIGIGGIGMSALARYFMSRGVQVSGYDKTETELTQALESAGATIRYSDSASGWPTDVQLVVYTPAIPAEHQGLQFYRQQQFEVVKRSDVLQIITEGSFNICIAGTHGKTTITTITGHLLRDTGYGCNAFLGGISANYQTNFWSDPRNVTVVEADEYDRSFLKLHPDIAVISAMDPDHLDIYGTAEAFQEAFWQFAEKRKPTGWLLTKFGLPGLTENPSERKLTYGLSNEATIYADQLQTLDGGYRFDVVMKAPHTAVIKNLSLHMGGLHNVENTVVAVGVAMLLGIEEELVRSAVASFKGVKRRFEYKIKTADLVVIDDYAHHPEELNALLNGTRNLFPDHHLTIVFQPHLYSRTKDQAAGFTQSLQLADEVILLPIYPAREKPMVGVNSEMLLTGMNKPAKILQKEELYDWIQQDFQQRSGKRVLVMAGAGDIDVCILKVTEQLNKQPSV
jgi:UDP-N-acetylmuramate--alanine ligase